MNDTLTFDIETIPMQSGLTDVHKEEITKKVEKELDRNPGQDPLQVRDKIMATSPYFGEIITIGVHMISPRGVETDAIVGTEKEILERFWRILSNFRGMFISYNGVSFDVPFIIKRSMHHEVTPTNSDFLITRRFSKYPHFDVQEVISDFDRFRAPSLRLACELCGIPSPKEGDVKAEDVYTAYKEGRINEIAEYCKRDVVATYRLYEKLDGYYN